MKKLFTFLLCLCSPLPAIACLVDSPPITLDITRAYPQPLEGEHEWVEIRNMGDTTVDLKYYTLEDATGKPMTLSGTLEAGASIKIDNLSFQLNNGSDELTLLTIEGVWVDSFSYESSEAGQSVPLTSSGTSSSSTDDVASIPTQWPDFSEALPNPEGNDSTEEWIELYNPYSESITLNGLKLDDQEGGSSPYSLSGTMEAHSFLVISVEDSKLNLNNSTDEVRLLLSGEVLWTVPYGDVEEGLSYALVNGTLEWTTPTPGGDNKSLLTDGQLSDDVEITEVFPDPEGSDNEDEWIEITNGGTQSVDLGNWTVDDGPGGSDPYTFPEGTIINPGESIVLDRATSGIALNNSQDSVTLRDFTGDVMDMIEYDSTQEAQSYSKIEVEEVQNTQASTDFMGFRKEIIWEWTSPSPGEANPKWKEFIGIVETYDAGLLTLLHGNSEFLFEVTENSLGDLLFQPGNKVMVQASMGNGVYKLIRAELLEQVTNETKTFPWSWIALAMLALSVMAYEWWKNRSNALPLFPHAQVT